AEVADLARVVAETAPREHGVEHTQVSLQARRAPADDLPSAERQRDRRTQPVVPARAEEETHEMAELAVPVGGSRRSPTERRNASVCSASTRNDWAPSTSSVGIRGWGGGGFAISLHAVITALLQTRKR